jgi:TonB family protein
VNTLHTALTIVLVGCAGTSAYGQRLYVTHAQVPTIYPPLALSGRMGGTVRVSVTVKQGTVANATVLSTSGANGFEEATTANIRSWQFALGVDTTFVTTFVYEVRGTVTEGSQNPRVELDLPIHVRIIASPVKPWESHDPAPTIRHRPGR